MTRPTYLVIPAGLLVNPAGLGLGVGFTVRRKAERECRRLSKKFPLAGYHVKPVAPKRIGA